MKTAIAALLVLAATSLAQIAPVEIIGAESSQRPRQQARQERRPLPLAPVLIAAGALAATSAATWWAWRRWARLDDAERAFLLLAFRSGLRHTARQRLRSTAATRGISPIAALLNER